MAEQEEKSGYRSASSSVWEFDNQIFDQFSTLQPPQITDEEVSVFRDLSFQIRHPDGKRDVPWPNDCEPQIEKFGGELATQYVYEWEVGSKSCRAYEVQVNSFIGLQYNLDFTGTENYDIQASFAINNKIISVDLQPFERETICLITCDTKEDNELRAKGAWKKCDIHPDMHQSSIATANNKIKDDYDACMNAGLNETVPYHEMPAIIRNNGLLFVDGEFYPGHDAMYFQGDDSDDNKHIMWRRAGDFITPWPMIFKNPNDMNESIMPQYCRMGQNDNAWLISVISVMSLRNDLICNLILSKDGSSDPATNTEDKMFGFYRVKLCHNGIWQEVVMDDFFPCKPYWMPIISNTPENNQLYCALIEKVYAKKKGGSYESLDGGTPASAFCDLTGCPTEDFDMQSCDTDVVFDMLNQSYNDKNEAEMFNTLAVAICNEDNLMGGDVEEQTGLLTNHCYSVLGINMELQMLCLRDPVGKHDYKGEYSEDWDDELRQKCGGFDEKNQFGIFWVSFKEFVSYFTTITMCYCDRAFTEARQTIDMAYDHKNEEMTVPVLKFEVPNGVNIDWIGFTQKDFINQSKNEKFHTTPHIDLCLFVLKAKDPEHVDVDNDEPMGYIPMTTQRQNFVQFGMNDEDVKQNDITTGRTWKNSDVLSEGTYWLIPWTSGNGWKEQKNDGDGDGGDDDDIETRYVGMTVHGSGDGVLSLDAIDGLQGKAIEPVLRRFAFKYGEQKQWNDLLRVHLQMGQLDVYCGQNTCDDKNLNVKVACSEMTNVHNVVGYNQYKVGKDKEFKVEPSQTTLFAVQVPNESDKEYSCAFKWGMKNEYL